MAPLSRESILGQTQLGRQPVEAFGGTLFVREITGAERDRFEATLAAKERPEIFDNMRARFVMLVACDEAGKPLFTPLDVVQLGELSAKELDKVFDAGRQLNGMLQAAADETKKNSNATPPAASP